MSLLQLGLMCERPFNRNGYLTLTTCIYKVSVYAFIQDKQQLCS